MDALCSLRSHGTRDKAGSIIDKGYRERVSVDVFCSLRSHGTRLSLARQSNPCLVMERVSVLCLQRMAQLSDLVIWCARN